MKIKLKRGKQKELILLAKGNFSWIKLANGLKISSDYLSRDLKNEKKLISDLIYYKLCKIINQNFDEFILEKLPNNWGQSKGGLNSKGSLINIRIPERNEKLAELIGIILGDGNVNYYKRGKKIGVYQVTIAGDKKLDRDYHLNHVSPLFNELFDVEIKEKISKKNNGRFLVISSKQLVNFFIENGLKSGDKIRNQVTIPPWIKENPAYLKACIRGLYDTDGSVYKLTNQNSYQVCFTNRNRVLLDDTRNALLSLGIMVSKITKEKDILITKKSELRKFLNEVGFQNPKHLNKVRMWNLDKLAP